MLPAPIGLVGTRSMTSKEPISLMDHTLSATTTEITSRTTQSPEFCEVPESSDSTNFPQRLSMDRHFVEPQLGSATPQGLQ